MCVDVHVRFVGAFIFMSLARGQSIDKFVSHEQQKKSKTFLSGATGYGEAGKKHKNGGVSCWCLTRIEWCLV